MNRGQPIGVVMYVLVMVLSLVNQPDSYCQKTSNETDPLLNNLPPDSVIAVSAAWKGATALTTIPFAGLPTFSDLDDYVMLKKQNVTHLLLTSRDIYSLVAIYGDSVSIVETDKGTTVLRYASRSHLPQTITLKESYTLPSSIYLGTDETPQYLENSSTNNDIKITHIVCEFISENETSRLSPQETFFKNTQYLKEENTCPYTVFINTTGNNPLAWTLICVQATLRSSVAIKLYLLDTPSEYFAPVHNYQDNDSYIRVWKLK